MSERTGITRIFTNGYLVRSDCYTRCPECDCCTDSLYGWDPDLRTAAFEAGLTDMVVLKEQCWNCGYHRAAYVPTKLYYEVDTK